MYKNKRVLFPAITPHFLCLVNVRQERDRDQWSTLHASHLYITSKIMWRHTGYGPKLFFLCIYKKNVIKYKSFIVLCVAHLFTFVSILSGHCNVFDKFYFALHRQKKWQLFPYVHFHKS